MDRTAICQCLGMDSKRIHVGNFSESCKTVSEETLSKLMVQGPLKPMAERKIREIVSRVDMLTSLSCVSRIALMTIIPGTNYVTHLKLRNRAEQDDNCRMQATY